jgi:ABC-type polysaccharide/polyol phosphate export permease
MSQVPEQYQWLMYMNPMAAVVQTFKWGVLGVDKFPALPLLGAAMLSVGIFAFGFWSFSRGETAAIDKM